jgi:hypothetical protein
MKMAKLRRAIPIVAIITMQLFTSGCGLLGGGGSVLGFFASNGSDTGDLFASDDSGGSSAGDIISAFSLGDSLTSDFSEDSSGGDTDDGDIDGGDTDSLAALPPPIARVHNPEPASVILFGSGLAGASLLRKRKARCRNPLTKT